MPDFIVSITRRSKTKITAANGEEALTQVLLGKGDPVETVMLGSQSSPVPEPRSPSLQALFDETNKKVAAQKQEDLAKQAQEKVAPTIPETPTPEPPANPS